MLIYYLLQPAEKKNHKALRDYFFKPYADYTDIIHTLFGFEGLFSDSFNSLAIVAGLLYESVIHCLHLLKAILFLDEKQTKHHSTSLGALFVISIIIIHLGILSPIFDVCRIFTRCAAGYINIDLFDTQTQNSRSNTCS